MAYQIVRISPVHCWITDGIIGSRASRLPNAYETEACANLIAGRLAEQNYKDCGDDHFRVVAWGGDPWTFRSTRPPVDYGDDEIPF